MRGDRELLAEHGTRLMVLKPSSLVQAAHADLARKRRNKTPGISHYEHYAFHRTHVKRAQTVAELLALASAQPGLGACSTKINTRLIYSDVSLLEQAKALA